MQCTYLEPLCHLCTVPIKYTSCVDIWDNLKIFQELCVSSNILFSEMPTYSSEIPICLFSMYWILMLDLPLMKESSRYGGNTRCSWKRKNKERYQKNIWTCSKVVLITKFYRVFWIIFWYVSWFPDCMKISVHFLSIPRGVHALTQSDWTLSQLFCIISLLWENLNFCPYIMINHVWNC